mmetsp:Transcript_20522/g.28674  ORF Transcript_20522/g.28674 Transcript_20522/m.28674 type:complete len:219 (-) Transcript_20522:533-1189(-)
MPLAPHASRSSSCVRDSTPSLSMRMSSSLSLSTLSWRTNLSCVLEPNGRSPIYWHRDTRWGLCMFSSVISSPNTLETWSICSLEIRCPFRTEVRSSVTLSLDSSSFSLALAMSLTVSCKKLAICRRACKSFFNLSSLSCGFLKLDGSILGKRRRATGNKNSMKGIMMNILNGTSLKISMAVRLSIRRSLLVSLFPSNAVRRIDTAVAMFFPMSLKPSQ